MNSNILFASYCGKMSKLKHALKKIFGNTCMWHEEPLNEPINATTKEHELLHAASLR